MKPSRRSRVGIIIFAVAVASLAVTWATDTVMSNREQTRKDSNAGARLTNRMKGVRVDRLLIDLPEDARVEVGRARIDGIAPATFNETLEESQKRLADREAQISAVPDHLGGNKNLESASALTTGSGLVGKMFMHSRIVRESTRARGLELERYRYEGVTVEALLHAHRISIDLSSENRDPQWVGDLSKPVAKLVVNPTNGTPPEAGYCVDHAYVRDPLTAEQSETITMFAQSSTQPHVHFSLLVAAGVQPDKEGLVERSNAALRLQTVRDRTRIKQLRAAPRTVRGLTGDELVESISEGPNMAAHSFWWEVNGTKDNVFVPYVMLRLDTGTGSNQPTSSSIAQGAATALGDKVLPTFRLPSKETRASTGHQNDTGASVQRSEAPADQKF